MIRHTGLCFTVSLDKMVPVLFQQHTDYFMKIYGKEEQCLAREAIFILGMFRLCTYLTGLSHLSPIVMVGAPYQQSGAVR